MSDIHALLADVAETVPVAPIDRAERVIGLVRRRRRTKAITAGAVLVVSVLTFVIAAPLAARLATREQLGPAGVPDQVFPVPLHAPTVGPGAPFGQLASLLLGGVPHADGWFGSSCCSLAVVGGSRDVSAFLNLPGILPSAAHTLAARLSPDGRMVAYPTGHGVELLDLVDGSSRTLTPSDGSTVPDVLGWSDDQTALLVATRASLASGGPEHLAVAAADGSSWVTLAFPAAWRGTARAAALKPDASTVAFVQDGQLWEVPVHGAVPARPVVTGLDNPDVGWAADGPGIAVLTVAPGPRGVVEPGAQRNVVVISERTGGQPDAYGEFLGYDDVHLLAHSEARSGSDVMVMRGSDGLAIRRQSEGSSLFTTLARLPANADPFQVDAATHLLNTQPRSAGAPVDPSHEAAGVAVGVGLLAALALPFILLRPRRSR